MQAAKATDRIFFVIEHLMLNLLADGSLALKSGHKGSKIWPHSG
jgi:hypothetical protein